MNPPPATAEVTPPLLSARQLAARRGERLLFRGLDLSLLPGEIVWLQGRNGRGKTTLLRMLSGLSSPAEGHVDVSATTDSTSSPSSNLLYLGHANAVKEDLTALESLRFLAAIRGRPCEDEALRTALKRLGIASRAQALVRTLSQGQRRRVSLARLALPQAPALWLLDEPLDALDRTGIATLLEILEAHAKQGGAILMTSHQPLALPERAVRVINLDDWAVPDARASRQAGEHRGSVTA